jgi:hypothetical protein
MTASVLGRAVVLVGLVCGLLAVSLPVLSGAEGSSRYVDDGTAAAYLIVLLSLSSWFPAEVGTARLCAALGGAAFGFFLFIPALLAFDRFGLLGPGAWLGLCTVLIPLGVLAAEPSPAERSDGRRGPRDAIALLGTALLVAGIWLPIASGGDSFWNASSSGHALGLLMVLLAVVDASMVAAPRLGDVRLVAAAATFGLLAAALVAAAFGEFGTLGAGAWLEACAGGLILGGAVRWPALARYAPASLSQSPR